MASKIRNGVVRLVIMRPEVVEFEFSGNEKLLYAIAEGYVTQKYPEQIPSAYEDGPVGDFYQVKLMEASVRDSVPEGVDLSDLIAPGL